MAFVGTHERETAAAQLRRHYLAGRLTPEELELRLQGALTARSERDLRDSLRELPPLWRDVGEIQRVGRLALRLAVRASLAAIWLLLTFVLLVAFALTAIAHGVTTVDAVAFPLAWLVATLLVLRAARRV